MGLQGLYQRGQEQCEHLDSSQEYAATSLDTKVISQSGVGSSTSYSVGF